MKTKKHNINNKQYQGEEILVTTPQSLDAIIYNHYQSITTERGTGQQWTACETMATLIMELNGHLNLSKMEIAEGTVIFMPQPFAQSADTRIRLWQE